MTQSLPLRPHKALPRAARVDTRVSWQRRLWSELIIRSWWVWSFALLCAAGYQIASQHQQLIIAELEERYQALDRQKRGALEEGERLLAQIGSQSDPVWIEQVLMRGLGVVPEGQTKVYFEGPS